MSDAVPAGEEAELSRLRVVARRLGVSEDVQLLSPWTPLQRAGTGLASGAADLLLRYSPVPVLGVTGSAGKTTTARLWEHDAAEILSDDRIVVRPHDGAWWTYGTPWHGEADICSPSRARLHRIFLLDQATCNAVNPLSPAVAVARMLSCTFPPFHDASGLSAIAGTLAAIADDVPVTRLSFVNDHSAVDFVREGLEVAA